MIHRFSSIRVKLVLEEDQLSLTQNLTGKECSARNLCLLVCRKLHHLAALISSYAIKTILDLLAASVNGIVSFKVNINYNL